MRCVGRADGNVVAPRPMQPIDLRKLKPLPPPAADEIEEEDDDIIEDSEDGSDDEHEGHEHDEEEDTEEESSSDESVDAAPDVEAGCVGDGAVALSEEQAIQVSDVTERLRHIESMVAQAREFGNPHIIMALESAHVRC